MWVEAHDESVVLVIDVLLQRCLGTNLDTVQGRWMDTDLIIHHCVANIVSEAGQCLRVLDIIKESRGFAPLCQRFQTSKSLLQFPGTFTSGSNLELDIK